MQKGMTIATLAWVAVFAFVLPAFAQDSGNTPAQSTTAPTGPAPSSAANSASLFQNPNPVASDAQAVSQDLGISPAQAEADLQFQPQVGELQAALQGEEGGSFGGMFISYTPSYQVTVLAAPGQSSTVAADIAKAGFPQLTPFVKISETQYTESPLRAALSDLQQLDTGGLVTTSDMDIRAGNVLLTAATDADVASLQATVASAKLPIPSDHVIIQKGGFQDQDSYGGSSMTSPLGDCTSGFSVQQTSGGSAKGVTDAAHCPNGM